VLEPEGHVLRASSRVDSLASPLFTQELSVCSGSHIVNISSIDVGSIFSKQKNFACTSVTKFSNSCMPFFSIFRIMRIMSMPV
jgi:hypothetical protein